MNALPWVYSIRSIGITFFTTAALSLGHVQSAYADPVRVSGVTQLGWSSYTGSTSGVSLNIGGSAMPTGEISFSLDPSFGSDNYYTYNWDTDTASIRLHLKLNSPLLGQIGASNLPIEINESGGIGALPMVEPGTTDHFPFPSVLMTGGGAIDTGPLAGVSFSNDNNWINITVNGNVEVNGGGKVSVPITTTVTTNSQHSGNIQQIGGPSLPTTGGGTGIVAGVPEPQTYAMMIAGLAMVGLAARRNKQ